MPKYQARHVKKGDEVYVISGAHKSREKKAKIVQVLAKKDRVIVEGVNMVKKHVRKSQQHPEGAILEREGSIHISNVMRADRFEARLAKRTAASK
jgi:large subunit ribosomal protein L24